MIVLAMVGALAALGTGQDPGNDSSVPGNAWSSGNIAAPWQDGEFCDRACQSPRPASDFRLRRQAVQLIREDRCEAAVALAARSRDGRLIRRVARDCPAEPTVPRSREALPS